MSIKIDLDKILEEDAEPHKRFIRDACDNGLAPLLDLEGAKAATRAAIAREKRVLGKLRRAMELIEIDPPAAARLAFKVLDADPDSQLANHVMAITLDRLGYLSKALEFYERAWKLDPEDGEVHHNLGMVAWKLDMMDAAEKFYRLSLHFRPGTNDTVINLAGVLRDTYRFDDAIELLREAIYVTPDNYELWNAIGTVMLDAGQPDEALTFYEEALRLNPKYARAWNNLAYARTMRGDAPGATDAFDKAMEFVISRPDSANIRYSRALSLLAAGRFKDGWAGYDARLDPFYEKGTVHLIQRPMWNAEDSPEGKTILLMGEQGLGDEVLFMNMLADFIQEAGPDADISLALESRLIPLAQRSFPTITIGEHATIKREARDVRGVRWIKDWDAIECWAPLGALGKRYRATIDHFPDAPFLVPDPDRVQALRAKVAAVGPGLKVGICWKSALMNAKRSKYFSPFENWKTVLRTPGVEFISLQYGDTREEIAEAQAELGVTIHEIEGVDLKTDLDGVAALGAALDLAVGPMNASTNLAASVGCPAWFLTIKTHWPKHATQSVPWYAGSRAFSPDVYGEWKPTMAEIASELAAHAARAQAA